MALSFDDAVSSLYCEEEDASIFDDLINNNYYYYCGGFNDDFEVCNWQHGNKRNLNNPEEKFVGFSGIIESSKMIQSEEYLASLFEKERLHFLGFDYLKRLRCGDLDLCARNNAIDWIHKVQIHYNFGPLSLCLAVNYLDRFLSTYELPKGKDWTMQLLAVTCLSLAAKIDETDVPFSLDLQVGESKFVFEAKTIQRMELLVLSTLKWRMQSVTPFSFIDYFLYKLYGDQMPPINSINQAIQLTLGTIKGIDMLEFRPSEIAAAVAISITSETQTVEHSDIAISLLIDNHVQKERVVKCMKMIEDMRMNSICNFSSGLNATLSVPQSPIGVLDAACLSYTSDDTSEFYANSTHNSPVQAHKRRKLDTNFKLDN